MSICGLILHFPKSIALDLSFKAVSCAVCMLQIFVLHKCSACSVVYLFMLIVDMFAVYFSCHSRGIFKMVHSKYDVRTSLPSYFLENSSFFAYIHTYIHTYIQTYIHTYKHFHTYTNRLFISVLFPSETKQHAQLPSFDLQITNDAAARGQITTPVQQQRFLPNVLPSSQTPTRARIHNPYLYDLVAIPFETPPSAKQSHVKATDWTTSVAVINQGDGHHEGSFLGGSVQSSPTNMLYIQPRIVSIE
jgi:hypothetical protein